MVFSTRVLTETFLNWQLHDSQLLVKKFLVSPDWGFRFICKVAAVDSDLIVLVEGDSSIFFSLSELKEYFSGNEIDKSMIANEIAEGFIPCFELVFEDSVLLIFKKSEFDNDMILTETAH